MSLKGLRFTLEVDGQEPDTFAVLSFRLIQNQSYPFVMSVDVASDSFMQTAEMLLEKKATLTIWQGVIPQRYVTGVVAALACRRTMAGRCVTTCVLSRRYGGAGCGRTSASSSSRISGRYRPRY